VGCIAPLGALGLPRDALRGKGGQGTLKVGVSGSGVPFFTMEVTLDQTPGNWCHFIEPIHRIENVLTVKQLLNTVSYFNIIFHIRFYTPIIRRMIFVNLGRRHCGCVYGTKGGGALKSSGTISLSD
jgi:hypothetical protein